MLHQKWQAGAIPHHLQKEKKMSKRKKVVMITDVDMSEDPDFVACIRSGYNLAEINHRRKSTKDDSRRKPRRGRSGIAGLRARSRQIVN